MIMDNRGFWLQRGTCHDAELFHDAGQNGVRRRVPGAVRHGLLLSGSGRASTMLPAGGEGTGQPTRATKRIGCVRLCQLFDFGCVHQRLVQPVLRPTGRRMPGSDAQGTRHRAHGTGHTAHGTGYTAHGTRHTAQDTRHTAHGTRHTAQMTQCS